MSDQSTSVKLSDEELRYLRDSTLLPHAELTETNVAGMQTHVICVSNSAAREIGGALTERLAKVGFDERYELTQEGRLLETLIDKFFVR